MNLQTIRIDTASLTLPDAFDLVFVVAAVAFNLLIVAIFVAMKHGRVKLTRALGIVWLALAVPLVVVFARYLLIGRDARILLCFGGIFLYMAVEFLLDYVLKFDFRRKWVTHAPYIVLEYVGLFSLIAIAFSIDRNAGYLVSVSFWILMAGLVYAYAGKKKGALT